MRTVLKFLLCNLIAFGFVSGAYGLTIPASEDTVGSIVAGQSKLTAAANAAPNLMVDATHTAFLYFNLNEVPQDAVLRWAKLRLFLPSVRVKGAGLGVHVVTSQWDEAAASNQPTVATGTVATIGPEKLGTRRFVTVDVTSTVQSWISGGTMNEGFAIKPISGGSAVSSLYLTSKDGASLGLPAELDLDFKPQGGVDNPVTLDQLPIEMRALLNPTISQLPPFLRTFLSPAIISQPVVPESRWGSLSVQAQGLGALSYQWMRNGVAIAGGTNAQLPTQGLQSGTYTVEVSNGFASVVSAMLTVSEEVSPLIPTTGTAATYQFVPGDFTWEQARVDAETKGGHLVTITSADELLQVQAQLGKDFNKSLWLGGYAKSGSTLFQWVTGEDFKIFDSSLWNSLDDPVQYPDRFVRTWENGNGWDDVSLGFQVDGYILETEPSRQSMVAVAGGVLTPSSSSGAVPVNTFYIGKTEVTWGEWRAVRTWAASNGYDLANSGENPILATSPTTERTLPEIDSVRTAAIDDFPVSKVDFYDALKWCNAKSQMEGKTPVYMVNGDVFKTGEVDPSVNVSANGYRLPKEEEWEFAARGGLATRGYIYSGSNNVEDVAWHIANSGPGAQIVATKMQNELGIFDMSGNMWEWCMQDGVSVVRGGDWYRWPTGCAITEGGFANPRDKGFSLGFRVARNALFNGTLKDGLTAYYPFNGNLLNSVAPNEQATLLGSTLNPLGWVDVSGSSIEYPDPLKVETNVFSASINVYETNLTDTAGGAYLVAGEGLQTTEMLSHAWVDRPEHWESSWYGNQKTGSGLAFHQELNGIRGKWVNYIIVSGNGEFRLFRDGLELNATQYQNNVEAPQGTAKPIFAVSGRWYSGKVWWMTGGGQMVSSERIVGRFDDLTVFNRALSDTEVAQLYLTLRKD